MLVLDVVYMTFGLPGSILGFVIWIGSGLLRKLHKIDFFAKKTQVSSSLIWLLISRSLCVSLEKNFSVLKVHMFMIVTQLFSLNFVEFWLIKTFFQFGSRAAKQQQKIGFPVSRLRFSFWHNFQFRAPFSTNFVCF